MSMGYPEGATADQGQMIPDLAALVAAGGAAPPQTQAQIDESHPDPARVIGDCITHLNMEVLPVLTDPQDVQDAYKAATILAGIQTRLLKGAPGGAPQT